MALRALLRGLAIAAIGAGAIAPIARAQEADLSVSKVGPAIAPANSDVSYSITVSNFGPDDAVTVALTDAIPAGMTFVSATQTSGPTFSCITPAVGAGGTITCNIATLPAASSADFTFVFHIPAATPPGTIFVNITSVTTATLDPNSENDSSVAVTSTPPPPQGDMVVTKQGPTGAGPDTDVAFTITLDNAGPDAAANVTLQDTLPGTMTFVSLVQNSGPAMSCTTPAVGAGGTITCTAATFAAGATATFTLTAHIPPGTPSGTVFTNTATVSSPSDPTLENDVSTHSVTVSSVDVSVLKSGPGAATAGANISYTVTVSNGGPDIADNVNLSDPLPPATTFVSLTQDSGPAASCNTPGVGANGTVQCNFSTLAPAAPAQFTLVINVGNTTSVTNTASVTTDSFDVNSGNNSSGVTTTITPSSDLSMTKSGPGTVVAGSNATYTVTVTNNGASDASNVSLTDVVPPNSTFVSASQTSGPAFSCTTPAVGGTGTISCNIAAFPIAASATFSFVMNAVAPGSITNTANVTAATGDPNPANNTASAMTAVSVTASDVSITKTAGPGPFFTGMTAIFTIVVTNNGPDAASGTVVTDVLPAGTTATSASSTQGSCTGTSTVICNIGTLATSATATITINVTLSSTPGPLSNTATVTVTNADPNPANNSSTTMITVLSASNIPALSPLVLALLALTLAMAALVVGRSS